MRKKKIFQGKMGFSVYDLTVRGRKVKREILEHPGAVAILPIDNKQKVLLVKQLRFPHGYLLEIPAGTLEKGEEPKKCAMRELQEETGYKAKKLEYFLTYLPAVGYSTEKIHCFLASDLERVSGQQLDTDEIMSVRKMDFKKLLRMIKNGKIKDSKTICTVLTYAAKKKLY